MGTEGGGLSEAQHPPPTPNPGVGEGGAQPKIDLGHPFATGARIAHGLPVGEAALIKRTIYKRAWMRERKRGDN